MTREEQIEQKAKELGQKYFPDECNVWARPNYEAQYVESACKEMIEWADEHPKEGLVDIDKACEWLEGSADFYIRTIDEMRSDFVEVFRKRMEEQQ